MKATVDELEDRFPAMRSHTDVQRQRTVEDTAHIVDFLATALYIDDAELFTGFIGWTADILAARGVPAASRLLAEQPALRNLRLDHRPPHLDRVLEMTGLLDHLTTLSPVTAASRSSSPADASGETEIG
ncbi:hypothetical protein [Mycobacterium sp. IDR2000157661]|uniref:hypothetical protein n=1 Tax=Mycobacterium sp. IDR2000157661 TaxID=2867005 RepID=UPI00351D1520